LKVSALLSYWLASDLTGHWQKNSSSPTQHLVGPAAALETFFKVTDINGEVAAGEFKGDTIEDSSE
jgi:hypothetical protein